MHPAKNKIILAIYYRLETQNNISQKYDNKLLVKL
jgi:hypothetical protein